MKENKMGVMPVKKLLIQMALPMMISMLVQALYNVVDSIFVARLSEEALTAVSMAFPMQNLMIGVSTGIGVGTNALLSRYLGEKNQHKANAVAVHGILLSYIGYLLFLLLGFTVSRVFFQLQGASNEIVEYGHQYLFTVLCLSFGLFTQIIFERLLQSTGKTFYAMITQGIGAIINIILDPIMIFGLLGFPAMGIRGAALATVIGQIVAGILAIIFNLKLNHEIQLSLKGFVLQMKMFINIIYIGVPSVIMMAIGSIMTFSVNKILGSFSSTAVAVFGVYFKLQSFAFMPIFGLNNGMVPIVAYNYGAKKPDRMIETVKFAVTMAVSIMICAFIVIQIIPVPLLSMFNASEHMLEIGIPAMRIISISWLFAGFCIISSSFFQALGNGIYSTAISFFRQLVFLVPLAYIFSKTGNVMFVWFAWPLAEIVSVICCLYYLNKINRKIIKPMKKG